MDESRDHSDAKRSLRRMVRARVAAMSPDAQVGASAALTTRLLAAFSQANLLMAYLAADHEPDLVAFLAHRLHTGQAVALPRADWTTNRIDPVLVHNLSSDCEVSRYSIVQPRADLLPLAPAALDVVLVPGVAFDPAGGRLGRGGGFYDRFLTPLRDHPGVTIAGICFDEQVVDCVPMHAHDVRVGMILTPTRTLVVRANN